MEKIENTEVIEIVKQVIAELSPGEVETSSLKDSNNMIDDLGYHSLALVELAFALEDKFDLEPIDQETAKNINTVEDIIQYVTSKLDAKELAKI